MPRKPRIISSTGIYHITLRSINQHIIFEEDADYQKLLYILSDCKTNFDIDIYAYCLIAYSARTAHPFRRNGAPFRFNLSKAQQVN